MRPARPQQETIWLALPAALVMLAVWTSTLFPLDYWLHVNNGRWMVEHGQLITFDTFSHTILDQPVKNQPWLAQLLMYGLHCLGGYRLNQFVAGLAYGLSVAGAGFLAFRACGSMRLAGILALATSCAVIANSGVRPQMFSVPLFVIQLWLLTGVSTGWKQTVGCFLCMTVWTNLHGAFPLGIVLAGLFFTAAVADRLPGAQARRWRYLRALVASCAGAFVRPLPSDTWSYVWGVSSCASGRGLEEWLPTSIHLASGWPLYGSVVLLVVLISQSRRRLSLRWTVSLAALLIVAVASQRMVIWWGLLYPLAVARPARSALRYWFCERSVAHRAGPLRPAPHWPGLVLLSLLLAISTPWTRTANPCLPAHKRLARPWDEPYPLAVSSNLDHLDRPVRSYAPLPWGAYLSWYSHGKCRSFVDSRVDFFPDRTWNDYLAIRTGGQRATELLDAYGVQWVVCGPGDERLASTLRGREHWRLAYEDSLCQLFAKEALVLPTAAVRPDREP